MTTDGGHTAPPVEPALPHPHVDRSAALAAGAPKVPRRAIVIGVCAAAILALGGAALERAVSNAGLNAPVDATTTTSLPTPVNQLTSSMASFLGLVRIPAHPAPAFTLRDERGAAVTLASLRGKVVVLTFFNATCTDACAVLSAEIRHADGDLGSRRSGVMFLTVNTDPLATALRPAPAALSSTHLGALPNWHYLTSSLARLNEVWRHYGVVVDVYTGTGRVTHNDVIYFIDPAGQVRLRATPGANESKVGVFTLPAAAVQRAGRGIAAYAAGLLGRAR